MIKLCVCGPIIPEGLRQSDQPSAEPLRPDRKEGVYGGGGEPKKRKWHTLPHTLPYNRPGTPMSLQHRPYTTALCVSGERSVIRSRICSVFSLAYH